MGLTTGIASGVRKLTHDEFEESIQRAASGLAERGVSARTCVAILMRNDVAFLQTSLAAQRLGAFAVPVNWHFKPDEVAYVLKDCSAHLLVGHADLLHAVVGEIPSGCEVFWVAPQPDVQAAYNIDPERTVIPDGARDWHAWTSTQAAMSGLPAPQTTSILYTSGTTGRPKGVRRDPPTASQAARLAQMRGQVYGLADGVRCLVPGPLYHTAPNAYALRAAQIADYCLIMAKFDPEEFLASVERERISHGFMVPTMFVRLLRLPADVRARYDLSSLQFIIHAAAPCPDDIKRAMIEWWGPVLFEFYGGTESGALTLSTSAEWLERPGTVGKLIEGAVVRAYDDDGKALPDGEVGELFMRLNDLPDFTYLNDDGKRRAMERDGLISLGDVGWIDNDGYVFICDRKRDMVISGGVNIYPAEVEAVLLQADGVRDCAVFGIPDAEFGETLIAVVQPVDDGTLSLDELRAHMRRHLANYKIPRRIEMRDELPREDSGKIFKRVLREPYWRDAGRRI